MKERTDISNAVELSILAGGFVTAFLSLIIIELISSTVFPAGYVCVGTFGFTFGTIISIIVALALRHNCTIHGKTERTLVLGTGAGAVSGGTLLVLIFGELAFIVGAILGGIAGTIAAGVITQSEAQQSKSE